MIASLSRLPRHSANADLLFRRLWVDDDEVADAHLKAVAASCRSVPEQLLTAVHDRRETAVRALAAAARPMLTCARVSITPQWRVVVGHGADSALETSLAMSPTYGVPIFGGTALKGLAAAQARHLGRPEEEVERLFGGPRPGGDHSAARRGSVTFLDALPTTPPVVVVDVLTPHVKPYYDSGNTTGVPSAEPAEYHNPVPIRFLAVARTEFRALLLGSESDLSQVFDLLRDGLDDQGIGGKTAAGYGYCSATTAELM